MLYIALLKFTLGATSESIAPHFHYRTSEEKLSDDVQYIEHFWWIEGALWCTLRRKSVFLFVLFFLNGFLKWAVRQITNVTLRPTSVVFLAYPMFPLFNTISVKQPQTSTFAAKEYISRHVENKEKESAVADELKIPRNASDISISNIKEKEAEKAHSASPRVRLPAYDDVWKSVYKWFLDVRAGDVPVKSPMLQKVSHRAHPPMWRYRRQRIRISWMPRKGRSSCRRSNR